MSLHARLAKLEARTPAAGPRPPYLIVVGCACADAPQPTAATLHAIGADVPDGRIHLVPGDYSCPRCAAAMAEEGT